MFLIPEPENCEVTVSGYIFRQRGLKLGFVLLTQKRGPEQRQDSFQLKEGFSLNTHSMASVTPWPQHTQVLPT